MKILRLTLSVALLSVPVFGLAARAQSDGHKMNAKLEEKAAPSAAQQSFDKMKTLAGTWKGTVTVDPKQENFGTTAMQITMRVTSRGNALVHEMQEAGTPLDPTKYDHPVTMLYVDGDKLLLTHYCDAGNRPRMTGKLSPDGKKVEFDFVDLSGGNAYGHMYHAVFTAIDDSHHIEDWTYMGPDNKPVIAHMDLQRER
jgi:hypothetical protein